MSNVNQNESFSNGDGCSVQSPNIVEKQGTRNEMEPTEIIRKPHRMKNYCLNTEHYDTLHRKVRQVSTQ